MSDVYTAIDPVYRPSNFVKLAVGVAAALGRLFTRYAAARRGARARMSTRTRRRFCAYYTGRLVAAGSCPHDACHTRFDFITTQNF